MVHEQAKVRRFGRLLLDNLLQRAGLGGVWKRFHRVSKSIAHYNREHGTMAGTAGNNLSSHWTHLPVEAGSQASRRSSKSAAPPVTIALASHTSMRWTMTK